MHTTSRTLRRGLFFAGLLWLQSPFPALAETYSFTGPSSSTVTYAPSILSGTNTNVTSYSSSFKWIYSLYTFNVDTTGSYTISATTTGVVNTMFLLNETYTPTTTYPPPTPISQFIASNFSGGNTSTIADMQLTEGQLYSVLVAYNQTTPGVYPYTVTLVFDGPGCVEINQNVCVAVLPTIDDEVAPLPYTEEEVAEELTVQATRQGVTMVQMQSHAVMGQLRQRMRQDNIDTMPTGSVIHAYGPEARSNRLAVFDLALAEKDSTKRWTAWADTGVDGLRGRGSLSLRGYQAAQQFGLDYRFANGWVAGASIGASAFDQDYNNGGGLSGNAYWIAPYLGIDLNEWLVMLQASYTYTKYDQFDPGIGVSGDTHGDRLSATLSLSRQFDLGSSFYTVPQAAISIGHEQISEVSTLAQGSIDDPRFFSAQFGGEFGYKLPAGGRVYGLAFAEYTDSGSEVSGNYFSSDYKSKEWSATFGGGFDLRFSDVTKINLESRIGGIGSDTLIYGGNARLSLQF